MGKSFISRVYIVEGLGAQSDLIWAVFVIQIKGCFQRNTCFVQNSKKGVEFVKRKPFKQTFTPSISMKWPLHLQFASWLVHFYQVMNTYVPSCEQGKKQMAYTPPKPVPNSKQRLHLLHMDLCGPMRIASINGKRNFIGDCGLLLPIHMGTFSSEQNDEATQNVGISHQASSVRTPQQNGVVERRNRTLVEAARTMLIFSRAPLFLWAEAIATAASSSNRSSFYRLI
ncbi:retrovirus-related pol polyprotein from transposon TNT 1-94 [Tanacetum coccineum]